MTSNLQVGAYAHPDAGVLDASARPLVSPVLVGRDVEFASAVSVVSAPPAVVVVEGEAGVGKTRLVTELLRHPAVAGLHRLLGRCHPIRESFPLGPVVEAVRGLHDQLGGVQLRPVTGALRALLPELADVLPPAPGPLDDRVAERHRVFRGLIDIIDCLGPGVLVLEDLHWADEQTSDFIAYLVSDPPPHLAVVLTYRTEDAGRAVRALSSRLPPGVTRVHVPLSLLDQHRTRDLVAAILDTETVSSEFATYLWQRTSGLPLAIEEMLGLVRARGLMVRHGGRWERKTLDELEVPIGIREPTLERVSRLPERAKRLAEAAAVVQLPVEPAVLIGMAGTRSPDAVEETLSSGILVEHGDRIGFRHLLAAQAVYDDLSGPRRRELHRRAADALQALTPVPLAQVSHHLKHAGRLEEWAHAAEVAADHAVEMANLEEVVRLLDDVLRAAPLQPDRRGRLAVKLGRAAVETMNSSEFIDVLSAVVVEDLARPVRGELRLLLVRAMNQRGDAIEDQLRLLAGAVEDLDDRPDLCAEAMVGLGVLSPRTMSPSERTEWLNRAVRAVGGTADPVLHAWVLSRVGVVLCTHGNLVWRAQADRVMEITGGSPQLRREVNAHYVLAVSACWSGHLDVAGRLLRGCRDAPATRESRRLEIQVRSAEALLAFCRGNWDGLGYEVTQLIDELSGSLAEAGLDVQLVAACLALAHGEMDDARRRLADVLDAAERLDDFLILPTVMAMSARVALTRGELDEAVGQVGRCVEALGEQGWAPIGRLLPTAVEVLVAAGRRADAVDLVGRAERELRGVDAPLAPPALRYARGVLASSPEDLLAAAELYEAMPASYEAAQSRERAAACFLAEGDARSATSSLRSAVASYERLGASWDRGRAAGLARQHGITLPSPRRGARRVAYGPDLSPREREVAQLASRGLTNKEIAAELYVSSNTVSKQLAAAMSKLGVHSRAAIAGRLAAFEGTNSPASNGIDAP
jgi:DNA-binding CsgD family transcriptional regulator